MVLFLIVYLFNNNFKITKQANVAQGHAVSINLTLLQITRFSVSENNNITNYCCHRTFFFVLKWIIVILLKRNQTLIYFISGLSATFICGYQLKQNFNSFSTVFYPILSFLTVTMTL